MQNITTVFKQYEIKYLLDSKQVDYLFGIAKAHMHPNLMRVRRV